MNKNLIRALTAGLLAAAMLTGTACAEMTDAVNTAATTEETTAAETTETTESADEVDRDAVAAEVGSYTVTYGDVSDYYDYYVQMLSYYGYSAPTDEAEIEELQDELLADYVNNYKQYYYADQYGIELSEEDLAEVKAQTDEEFNYYLEDFIAQAQEEGLTDEDAINTRAKELFTEDLTAYGYDMDADEYYQAMYDQYKDDKRVELLEEYVNSEVTVSEDDIQTYYDSLVEDQTSTYTDDPAAYADDEESYEEFGGDPIVVVPENYIRVKVIEIAPTESIDSTYTDNETTLEAYEAEYGALALKDDPTAEEKARMEEIRTAYAALKAENDATYETYIADTAAKAEEAYAKLESGEDFDTVLTEYGNDTDYATYESILANGKLMMTTEGANDGWDDEVRAAAAALTPGTYSMIVKSGDTYYIVYLVSEVTAGTVSLSDVHDAVAAKALEQAQSDHYEEVYAGWEADDSMVVYHEEVFRSIGK